MVNFEVTVILSAVLQSNLGTAIPLTKTWQHSKIFNKMGPILFIFGPFKQTIQVSQQIKTKNAHLLQGFEPTAP